ncbi:MAG: patatin-like phospholipase family protein [Bacteroidota bacterium]
MSRNVALVLSSGGARGLAHIGVIDSLQEQGFHIRSIAGSSIGAVVGAFYAAGQLDTYKEWMLGLDQWSVLKLMDFTLSAQGFLRGEKIFKTLETMIEDQKIQDLSIPFVAVATDIQKGKEVVFKKGSMYRALKASASIPTVIKPTTHKGRELIDGGVMTPIPVEFVKRKKSDLLVIVNVSAPGHFAKEQPEEQQTAYVKQLAAFKAVWERMLPPADAQPTKKLGYFDLLARSIDLMQDKVSNLLIEKYQPDLVVNIPRDACGVFDFHKGAEMIKAGRNAFAEAYAQSAMRTELGRTA